MNRILNKSQEFAGWCVIFTSGLIPRMSTGEAISRSQYELLCSSRPDSIDSGLENEFIINAMKIALVKERT